MRAIFTFSLMILISASLSALNYVQYDQLYNHLTDVNKEWLKHDKTTDLEVLVNFPNDIERIRTHLKLVEQNLRNTNTSHLSAEALANREAMLDVLNGYWKQGVFPVNLYHNHRQPYFIDDYGTACAVGFLMIASGNETIALKIKQHDNYAYIHELTKYPELGAWAEKFGFTIEELAWIQPAYQSDIPADPLGTGTNGTIKDILITYNYGVIAAGEFTEAGGKICTNIARWDGAEWNTMGAGVNGKVNGLKFDLLLGNIIAYGSFNNGDDQIAHWTGSAWSYYSLFPGKKGEATAHWSTYYHSITGGWYMDGSEKKYFITNNNSTLTEYFNDQVNAITEYYDPAKSENSIIVGGKFTATSTGTPLNHLAHIPFNGGLGVVLPFGTGLDSEVRSLLSLQNSLYASGNVFDEQKNAMFGLAKYVNGQWQQVVDLSAWAFDSSHQYIDEIMVYDSDLYIAGKFQVNGLMYYGNNVAVVNETGNYAVAHGSYDAPVHALAFGGNKLYAAGDFTKVGTKSGINHIVSFPDQASGLHDKIYDQAVTFPNPASDRAEIRLERSIQNGELHLFDVSGKLIQNATSGFHNGFSLDVSGLAAGLYIFRISENGEIISNGKINVVK